jgi:hypothetical protein
MISQHCAMRYGFNPIHFTFSPERWELSSPIFGNQVHHYKKDANLTLEIENIPSSNSCTNRSYGLTCGELISGHAYIALGNRAYPLRL